MDTVCFIQSNLKKTSHCFLLTICEWKSTFDLRASGMMENVSSHMYGLWTFVIPMNCSMFSIDSIVQDQASFNKRSWKWPSVSWIDSVRCNCSQLSFSHIPFNKLSSQTPLIIDDEIGLLDKETNFIREKWFSKKVLHVCTVLLIPRHSTKQNLQTVCQFFHY